MFPFNGHPYIAATIARHQIEERVRDAADRRTARIARSGGQVVKPHPVEPEVTVYRRRGCPYCIRLECTLRAAGVRYLRRDVWRDPEAAGFVRAVTGGDETVPTVVVAGQTLVNPSPWTVITSARASRTSRSRRRASSTPRLSITSARSMASPATNSAASRDLPTPASPSTGAACGLADSGTRRSSL
jgi:glutaredoxin